MNVLRIFPWKQHTPQRAEGIDYELTATWTWAQVEGASTPIAEAADVPSERFIHPLFIVTFADGSRAATHGDVYANPAAWRTDASGAWRATVAPPSSFITHGTVIFDQGPVHEALFLGQQAFVLTIIRR